MDSSTGHAAIVIHYAASILILLYYLLSSLWGVCMLESSKTVVRPQLNKVIIWTSTAIIATFVSVQLRELESPLDR